MPLEDKLKQQLDFIKKYKKVGPKTAKSLINEHDSLIPNYAQPEPSSFDPLTPDQLSSIDLSQPSANAGIPPMLQTQGPDDLSPYIARPAEPSSQQVINPITPQQTPPKPKAVVEAETSMPSVDQGEQESDYDPNDSIQNPSNVNTLADKSATDYLNMSKQGRAPAVDQQPITQSEIPTPQAAPTEDFAAQLENAHQQDAKNQLLFGLLKASQMGGAALAGSKADTSYADAELARPNQNVTNLKTSMDMLEENANILQKKKKRDKGSEVSKLYRDVAHKLMPDLDTTGMSAEDLEKIHPELAAIVAHKDTLEANKAKWHELGLKAGAERSRKDENEIDKQRTDLDKHITNQLKGRTGIVQSAAVQKQRAESIGQMFENLPKTPDGKIDFATAGAAHKEELIKGIDMMLSGGKTSISGTEHLRKAYANAFDKLTEIRQKLSTGELPNLNQSEVINQMYDLVQRETEVAKYQIAEGLGSSTQIGFRKVPKEEKQAVVENKSGVPPVEQELMTEYHTSVPMMMKIKSLGLDPEKVLEALKSGKKISDVMGKTTTVSKEQAKATPSDLVKILLPNGSTVGIPKENLDKAIARGAKVVQ